MTAEPTDLAERVALALPGYEDRDYHEKANIFGLVTWWRCRRCEREWYECGSLTPPEGNERPAVCKRPPPKLDCCIVPVVVEAIREREWCCEWAFDKAGGVARIYPKDEPWVVFREDPDPVVALCKAFVAAQEARQASEQG